MYDFDANQRLVHQSTASGAEQWWQFSAATGFMQKATTRLTAGSGAAGSYATTVYETNEHGLVTKRTDPNGAVWQWTYNSKGRVTKEIDPYGFTIETVYPSDDLHAGSVSRWALPTESTELLPVAHGDATTSYTYTDASTQAYGAAPGVHPPLWLLATVTDELDQETKFSYDQGGDLRWSRTGNVTQGYVYTRFTYDAVGRKLTTETSTDDTNWTVTEDNAYDAAGRVIRTDGPLTVNAVTGEPHRVRVSTVYDDAGNPLSVTKSDVGGGSSPDPGRETSYHYDDAQRLDRVTDALGNTTDRVYYQDGNLEATVDARGTRVEYTYDLAGRELTTTVKNFVDDPIGAPAVMRDVLLSSKTYDVAGRLVTETDALGRVTTTTYDPAGMGWPVKVTLTFDSYTNILAATQYDLVGRMEEVWRYGTPGTAGEPDVFVQRTKTEYDLWGRAATVTTYDAASNDAGGGTVNRVESTIHNVSGAVETTKTTGGTDTSQTSRMYLENGWLKESIVENGDDDLITMYDYDEYGRIKSITDPSGNVTTYTYDVAGRSVSTTLPTEEVLTVDHETGTTSTASSAATTTLGYNTFGEVTHTENAIGLVTVTGYDLLGRREQITHPSYTPPGGSPVVPTETFRYDANGNLESSVNRIGSTTTFTYDMMNRVVQRSDPAAGAAPAGVTRYTYDDAGNVLSTTDPIGAVVETTYDEMNLPKSTTQKVRREGGVDSFTSTVERDLAGRPWRTCSPQVNGQIPCSTATYSPFGQPLRQIDPLGHATVYDYDGLGRVKSATDPGGHKSSTAYDPAGRAESVSHVGTDGMLVDTTTFKYTSTGKVDRVYLPGGGELDYDYDSRNRMTSVRQLKAATPLPEWIAVSYDYDNLDRLVSTVDGRGNQWLTTYNSLGLEQDQIEPSTPGQTAIADRRYTSHYNAGGLLVQFDEPGGVHVQYAYDELARLTAKSAAMTAATPAAATSFGYDAAGRMTSFSAPGGDVALTYDDRGLLLSASGPNTPSSFEYDALGRMTSRTDATGESLYLWDSAGRLQADTDPLTNTTRTFVWEDWGVVESVSYSAGGMQRVYGYDTAGRLASDTLTGDGVEQRRTLYGYDSAGRLVTETISGVSTVVGQGLNSYDYDEAGRLKSWTDPGLVTTTYGWDDAGNRDRVGAVSSVYDARNRVTSSGGDSFVWSARGTLVSQSVSGVSSGFVFDGLGRMVTVDGLGYQYDGLGRVAARSDGAAGWVGFAYSGVGLQPVSDGNGLIARSPGGDPVATKVGSGAAVSVGLNRHGDVTSMFDPVAGTVQGSVEFDPFGVVTGSGGVSAGNIGFQGAYTDPVSKLVDMGARWYSPGMGRFVSRDTIRALLGTPVSLNMYTYANNDPLGFYDPDGHQSADTCERTGQCSKGDANGTRGTKPKTTPYKCVRHCPDGQTYGVQPRPKPPSASGLCPDGRRKIDGEYCPHTSGSGATYPRTPVGDGRTDSTLPWVDDHDSSYLDTAKRALACWTAVSWDEAPCRREDWLRGYANMAYEWGAEFDISPVAILAVIGHEGGNFNMYGDDQRNAERVCHLLGKCSSVGIAQFQPGTARLLIEEYWGVDDLDLDDIAWQLEYNDELSVALVAAYASSRVDIQFGGSATGGELFVAHAASDAAVASYVATGRWGTDALVRRAEVHAPVAFETASAVWWNFTTMEGIRHREVA